MAKAKSYVVKDVAKMFGISDRRVRQICQKNNIGVKIGPIRILSSADVARIEKMPDLRLSDPGKIALRKTRSKSSDPALT